MNRLFGIVTAMLLTLLILVPAAAAADPFVEDGRVLVTVGGELTFPEGQYADSLVVIDGSATIEGDARSVFVVNGSVDFVGSEAGEVVAIASDVSLDGATTVTGDLRVIETTVSQADGATIRGDVIRGFDWANAMLFIGPALFIAYMGFVLIAIVAAMALAGLASRQLRAADTLLRQEFGTTIVAGFGGVLAIVLGAVLAMVTVVGIPLGLVLLVGFLPVMAFAGYLVAGISIGRWVIERFSGGVERERPYVAAIVGILLVSAVSFIPFVGALVSFVGFGGIVLLMWRTLRGRAAPTPELAVAPATASAAG